MSIDPFGRVPAHYQLNLVRPPPAIQHDQGALGVAYQLNSLPLFNRDGDPRVLSGSELAAMLSHHLVMPGAKAALSRLIPHMSAVTGLPPASGVPPEREAVRRALAQRGIEVFSGVYPPDQPVPEALKNVTFNFPFQAGQLVKCQQQHNTMAANTTHRPDALRYALDFCHPEQKPGLPMTATASGIAYVYDGARDNRPDNWGFGNMLLLDHGNGYASLYSHLGKVDLATGANVETGQHIGTMGTTGSAGNAHLHFQVVKLIAQPDPASEMYHGEFGDMSPRPAPPFEQSGVPFFMAVEKMSEFSPPGRINSLEFRGGEAGMLMEYGQNYRHAPIDT